MFLIITPTSFSSENITNNNFTQLTIWMEDFWNSSSQTSSLSPFFNSLVNNISISSDYIINEATVETEVKFCDEWEAAQHSLFQTANIFFAAAFLVPKSFKQSLLLLRGLLCIGFLLSTLWAGIHVCAPDAFAWNLMLVLVNTIHTILLTHRFLPPSLSLELTELYLKLFKPLRVSKKHFKELSKEGQLMHLEQGENYAVEDITSADEKLSILLRGKLRVTCDDIHLHYINPHQFIDSPEWEANHENSDDVFQVTITAEQECLYLCWSRLKLERVLRHRPLFKVLFSNIIGKDITHKLYSLNEHLDTSKNGEGRSNLGCHSDYWKTMNRSLSVDAVHTGTQGHVRSLVWRAQNQRRASITNSDRSSPGKNQQFHYWVPVIADQFPETSPFTTYAHTVTAAPTTTPQISQLIPSQVLGSQTPISQLQSSFHNSAEKEEKFETPV